MRFSEILAASSLVAAPLVAAHGDVPHAPKIWGLGPNPMQKLKGRNFAGPAARRAALPQHAPQLNKRQGGADGRCGPEGGGASCDEGYCCSSAGWCGNTEEYCMAPDCLFNYGPACDANKVPNGADTRNIARPQLGSVPYGGEGIYQCTVPGTVAITYDDGPYIYTNDVLDQFASYGMKATFFITGNNIGKGAIDDASTPWPAVISRMLSEGHQVASHTWSHQDLSAITQAQRIDQMVHNEMAIRNIIQKFPTYMRPPYSSCTAASGCQSDLADLGYVVSYFNLDTDDYNNVTPDLIQNAKDNFYDAINPSNPSNDDFLAIAHDIHQQTALNLTGYMLGLLQQKGYRGVTMGECMGDPEANWYRDSSGTVVTSTSATPSATQSGSSTLTPPTATPSVVSQDGSCGGTNGYTCIGFADGECCSQYGWCGTSTDHCGTGCNPFYGNCGSSSGGSSTVAPSSTPATSTPTSTPTGLTSSPDGTCGPNTAYTCIGFELGECCSTYGWCGNTADHCGTGCNPLYGNCGSSVSSSSVAVSSSTASSVTKDSASSTVSSEVVSSTEASSTASSEVASSTEVSSTVSSDVVSSTEVSSVHSSVASSTEASSTEVSSTSGHPDVSSTVSSSDVVSSTDVSSYTPTSDVVSSTDVPSYTPSTGISSPSSTPCPSSSSPTTYSPASSSAAPSTIKTSFKPTSTPCKTSKPTPTPTPKVSTNGKCGTKNGGMTCKGYKGWYGRSEECCRWDGKCGGDVFSCGMGCQKKFGKCWW